MPTSLTLENGLCSPKVTREFLGWQVPWEVAGYAEDFARVQRERAVFDLTSWGVVGLSGPDAKDFLQRMSTVDMRNFSANEVRHGAFLTGRGTMVALGMFLRLPDRFLVVVSPGQAARLAEHLEKFHFAENLQVEDLSARFALWGEWRGEGPTTPLERITVSHQERWRDDLRPELIWVLGERTGTPPAGPFVGQHLFEWLRIQAGIPQMGLELSEKEIVLEGGFDRAVARNKGCYPGQEVVERIFTYGQVNRKLMPVVVTADHPLSLPVDFEQAGKKVATLVAVAESPSQPRSPIGLAFIHKNYWDFRDKFTGPEAVTLALKKA